MHSSSEQPGLNTALNDARKHTKGLKRRRERMPKKISKEDWERRIKEAGVGRYDFVKWAVSGEFGSHKKCVVRCANDGYEWSAEVNSIVNNGRGCPKCAGNIMHTSSEYIDKINSTANGRFKFVCWTYGFSNSRSKATCRCSVDGFEWSACVYSLVNNGSGCPQCAGNIGFTDKDRIDQINSLENILFLSWVDGYKNGHSKANVKCSKDGFEWESSVSSLVNGGTGCPQCSGMRRWTADERIEQINKLENIRFVSWFDGYQTRMSKAVVTCRVHDFSWAASVNNLINGQGCPQCGGVRRWTTEERIEQINSLDNIEFVSWSSEYKNHRSKANVRCTIDNFVWSSKIDNLVNCGRRCPKCAKSGYDPSKTGTLYALRSECGMYVKVGISNKPSRRHNQLEKTTPFKFNVIERISGGGAKIAALEKCFHNKYERAGFTGFDGCTEWLMCTPQLLEELRELEDVK